MKWSRFAAFVVLLVGNLLACKRDKGAAVEGRSKVTVGSSVEAPWGVSTSMYKGKVTALYGKLGHIHFDDGDQGWVDVTRLKPAGEPAPAPSDPCSVKPGQNLKAPWGTSKAMFPGKVSEVHGKFAHIVFDDGDKGWALCSETSAD